MSSHRPHEDDDPEDEDPEAAMLDPDEALEEVENDGDHAMDSGSEDIDEEIQLQNDSVAHFDLHQDSIFCIAQHPLHPNIVATGGSEGEDLGGVGYIFDSTPAPTPVLPKSFRAEPEEGNERASLEAIFKLEGHTDSINALAFTKDALFSGGLDGRLQVYIPTSASLQSWKLLTSAQEVEEINWLAACPHPSHPNTIALGASDGSVWVYSLESSELHIIQSYFLHTAPCTAGSWSADGKLLATVSDEGSLYVWDAFGEAAAAGVTSTEGSQTVVALTAADQRFAVDGGLFSVAIAPSSAFVVVGGAGGAIKVVGLPRLASGAGPATGGAKNKAGKSSKAAGSVGQAGQILADLQAQSDGIESLAFAAPPLTLLAAGSVDGSIALFDSAHRFAVRRHIKEAHEEFSVVKVEFGKSSTGYILTSCGMDGVVRRWDARGGTAVANSGLLAEWKGHRGEGEGGGVLGFVQGDGSRIVTAGDDGIALVFDAPLA